MAGDWIKMRTNLDTDPAVVRISSGLKTDRFSVVGRLHKIWAWANEHLSDGQDVPIDAEFLDCLVETPGFSAELRSVGWLSGRDGSLSFPHFERHNGASAKARAQDADRKKVAREVSGKCPGANRTKTGPEERREEKRRIDTNVSIESLGVTEFFSVWNATAGVVPMANLTPQRRKAISARMQNCEWKWREALAKFPLKCFASEPDGWRPNIDFFLRPNSVAKILEGTYDWKKNGNHKSSSGPGQTYFHTAADDPSFGKL